MGGVIVVKNNFKKGLVVGIIVCMLLITIILPVSASYEENNEIETRNDVFFGKMRYFGIIRGYTIVKFTNCQFYEVDFVIGIQFASGLDDLIPRFGFTRLMGIQPIPMENLRMIFTNHLCYGVERF